MHNRERFPNVNFGASTPAEGATLGIVLMLLGLVFMLLFVTLNAQLAQGQSTQNRVPPTAPEAAASRASALQLSQPTAHKVPAPGYSVSRRASPQGIFAPPTCFDSGGDLFIIHSFTQQENPSNYGVFVAIDNLGNLFGAATGGGDYDYGLAYKLALKNQAWTFTPLYSFTGEANGYYPSGPIAGPEGAIYGVARGGINNCQYGYCGLVYQLRPTPTSCRTAQCSWTENVLYRFTGSGDGFSPANLAFDHAGNLYGTVYAGGAYGYGLVYQLLPSRGSWTEKVLYNFTGGSDGGAPDVLLAGNDGNLYGSARSGGDPNCDPPYGGCGVVFQLVPSANGWTENVLYTFHGLTDGSGVGYQLVQDSSGNLYGSSLVVTQIGGVPEKVFLLAPSNGGWTYSVIWQSSQPYMAVYGLAVSRSGDLYGVATDTGLIGPLVFEFFKRTPDGQLNEWTASNFWFPADYGVAVDGQGNLYGTTRECGAYGYGTVWQFTGFPSLSP